MRNLLTRKIVQPDGIEIRLSPLHGLGVFATRNYRRGAVIEICPTILMQTNDKDCLQGTILFNYYFLLGHEKFPVALGLGYSSLYNHAYDANASYTISVKNSSIKITACRCISPGDEITINYNGKPGDSSQVYFESV